MFGFGDGLQTKYADGKSFKTKFDIHVYVFEFLMPCIINIWSSFYRKTFSICTPDKQTKALGTIN